MTDNEFVKALECCDKNDCFSCPYRMDNHCISDSRKDVIDLINRQKAEIERLQKECEITRAYIHNNGLEWGLVSHLEFCKNQRAEARKEFAEKVITAFHDLKYPEIRNVTARRFNTNLDYCIDVIKALVKMENDK